MLVLYCGELNQIYTRGELIGEGTFLNGVVYMLTEGLLDLVVIIPVYSYLYQHGYDTEWIETNRAKWEITWVCVGIAMIWSLIYVLIYCPIRCDHYDMEYY